LFKLYNETTDILVKIRSLGLNENDMENRAQGYIKLIAFSEGHYEVEKSILGVTLRAKHAELDYDLARIASALNTLTEFLRQDKLPIEIKMIFNGILSCHFSYINASLHEKYLDHDCLLERN